MNNCECDIENPVKRDGTKQTDRLLAALDPTYSPIDGREVEDLLLFIQKFASLVAYYDTNNLKENSETHEKYNWEAFANSDITTLIATVSRFNWDKVNNKFDELLTKVEESTTSTAKQKLNTIHQYRQILEFLLDTLAVFVKWQAKATPGLGLYNDSTLLLQSALVHDALDKIKTLEHAVEQFIVLPVHQIHLHYPKVLGYHPVEVKNLFDQLKLKNNANVVIGIDKDIAIDTIKKVFQSITSVFLKINASSSSYMSEALNTYPDHQPHFALLLCFLELMKYVQKDLNGLTKKHLEYYYKEVLQLKEKDPIPDSVYAIFELAKNIDSYKVASETGLDAGKDSLKNPVIFTTDKEIIVNKASVAELKTIFLDKTSTKVSQVYDAPNALLKDGVKTPFAATDNAVWLTFGGLEVEDEVVTNMEKSTLGFAVTSPLLLMAEGVRTIILKFWTKGSSSETPTTLEDSFDFYYTGLKAWQNTDIVATVTFADDIEAENTKRLVDTNEKFKNLESNLPKRPTFEVLTFTINIGEKLPAIVPFSNKIHEGFLFDTTDPIIKIIPKAATFDYFKDTQIIRQSLQVSATNIQNLILQNDLGKLDSSKPFMPFGSQPTIGSTFYVGHQEILNKKLASFKLAPVWQNLPTDIDKVSYFTGYTNGNSGTDKWLHQVKASVLAERKWLSSTKTAHNLFSANLLAPVGEVSTQISDTSEVFTEYANTLNQGFVKFELSNADFGHSQYANVVTMAVLNNANIIAGHGTGSGSGSGSGSASFTLPNTPYTPIISSLSVDYESEIDNTFELYQIYPFGFEKESLGETKVPYLLPQFVVENKDKNGNIISRPAQQGFLFIGLKDVVPPQNVSMLLRVAEDSGNGDNLPTITWRYLTDSGWTNFKQSEIVSDSTKGSTDSETLLTTGIIEFAIPEEAVNNNLLLTDGLFWISGSVATGTDAINKMISITAQAVQATFDNRSNDPTRLATALEATTISKLENKVSEIKTVTQPYASFNGKVAETGNDFYQRVSERLRHKNRAINIWDYERLVLENFTSVWKVRCLQHNCGCTELAPNHVTLITISNLHNQNAVNPLQPKTSKALLEEITVFLQSHQSPFLKNTASTKYLEVINPTYEPIRANLQVKFNSGYDKGFYVSQLEEDLKKFLSPWAYDTTTDIKFGRKIYVTDLINFIEELVYVDYIAIFKMYKNDIQEPEFAEPSNARAILVSNDKHEITAI